MRVIILAAVTGAALWANGISNGQALETCQNTHSFDTCHSVIYR